MAKDPAFLFYPSDFLTGVQDLTMEERGQYITMLCLQHQKGPLTEKMILLCCGNAAADVMAKFRQDSDGNYYNERLRLEIEKRAGHAEKQRQRALEGWKKRKSTENQEDDKCHGINPAYATALPLENRNENENKNEIKEVSASKKFSAPDITQVHNFMDDANVKAGRPWPDHIVTAEATAFFNYYESNGWKVGRNPMKNWEASARNWMNNSHKLKSQTTIKTKHDAEQLRQQGVADMRAAIRANLTGKTGSV